MKRFTQLLFTLLILGACSETPAKKINKDGVSLTSPKGWEITEEENLDDLGYSISIEKDGMSSSGLFSITWVNGEIDLFEWMNDFQHELGNNVGYKDVAFTKAVEGTFHGIETQSASYTTKIIGVQFKGIVHSFHQHGKSFLVLMQEAKEDASVNRQGFASIEQSFAVE